MKSLLDVYIELKNKAQAVNDNFAVYYWNMRINEIKILGGDDYEQQILPEL